MLSEDANSDVMTWVLDHWRHLNPHMANLNFVDLPVEEQTEILAVARYVAKEFPFTVRRRRYSPPQP